MKSAFELALERSGGKLNVLSEDKKAKIAEIDKKYSAKIAGARVTTEDKIKKESDPAKIQELEETLVTEIASLRDRCEREKEEVRGN